MAYYSVAAANATELYNEISAFLQANGWALSDGILSIDGYYLKLNVVSTYVTSIVGSGQSGATMLNPNPSSGTSYVFGTTINYPVTLHMFSHSTPARSFHAAIRQANSIWIHASYCNMVKFGTQQTGAGMWHRNGAVVFTNQARGDAPVWYTDNLTNNNSPFGAMGNTYRAVSTLELPSISAALAVPVWIAYQNIPGTTLLTYWSVLGYIPNIRRTSIMFTPDGSDVTIDGATWMVSGFNPATQTDAYAYKK